MFLLMTDSAMAMYFFEAFWVSIPVFQPSRVRDQPDSVGTEGFSGRNGGLQ